MALRMIECILPREVDLGDLFKDTSYLGLWHEKRSEEGVTIRVLVNAEDSEELLSRMEHHLADLKGFRIILFPVEASFPGLDISDERMNRKKFKEARLSREELYSRVIDNVRLTPVFALSVFLASVVGAIGILNNDIIIIIGAMVMAPLLGPNVGLSLAAVMGDIRLLGRALFSECVGIGIVILFSIIMGLFISISPENPAIFSRTQVDLGNILLALASGAAGVLAFTTNISAALIGVMVAAALLPPLVVTGLLIGRGLLSLAIGPLILFCANLICINLAGILTLMIQELRPVSSKAEETARKIKLTGIGTCIILLSLLIWIIKVHG